MAGRIAEIGEPIHACILQSLRQIFILFITSLCLCTHFIRLEYEDAGSLLPLRYRE